jgi:hypothetical protein
VAQVWNSFGFKVQQIKTDQICHVICLHWNFTGGLPLTIAI